MKALKQEQGSALIAAILILMIVLGLTFGVLGFADSQQHATAGEQSHESAFALAEAAMNAQVSTLATAWATPSEWAPSAPPSSCSPTSGSYPTGCVCNASTTFAGCPDPNGSWLSAYTPLGSASCPPGAPADAWGTATASSGWSTVPNGWTTYVRDDGGGTGQLFNSSTDSTQPPYDVNANGSLWVRAVGIYNCQVSVVVTRVSQQITPLTFPRYALNVNGFTITDKGNKVIIDTAGTYAQPSNPNSQPGTMAVRCGGLASGQSCTSYRTGSQLSPDTCVASTTAPYGCTVSAPTASQTVTDLSGLKALATSYGTYFAPGSANGCPTTASQLQSVAIPGGGVAPVFVDVGCPNISISSTAQINSPTQPGFLVLTNQTLSLSGSVSFYGMVYDANLCSNGASPPAYSPCTAPATMISVSGTARIQGAISIDGAGMASFGNSGNANFIYDQRVFNLLQTFSGAAGVPNSFRVLPVSQ